jgi:NH3-dependent NAD+ synthetase
MDASGISGPTVLQDLADVADSRLHAIIDWIRKTTRTAGGRGVLVPVSGGSDSALCFWLCVRALPAGKAVAAYVGDPGSLRRRDWFERVGRVDYLPAPTGAAEPEALRWAAVLSHSRKVRCFLAGSRNRTEEVLGTFSLASRVAVHLPLAGLWKSQVMELCGTVGVPEEITDSSRVADPACGRPQEMADIPFGLVDLFLQVKVGERPAADLARVDRAQHDYLESVYQRNRFKATLPLRPPPCPGA